MNTTSVWSRTNWATSSCLGHRGLMPNIVKDDRVIRVRVMTDWFLKKARSEPSFKG